MDSIPQHSFTYIVLEFDFQQSQLQQRDDVSLTPPSGVEEISLKLTFQIKQSCFVEEDGLTMLLQEQQTRKIPLSSHRLDVNIFNHGDESLSQQLSKDWARLYGGSIEINTKDVASEIISQWVQIREKEENCCLFGKVFGMEVNLMYWEIDMLHESSSNPMVPASDNAIKEMLKRVEFGDGSCVICLEEMSTEEEEKIVVLLEMPCLHVFHGECIQKWLNTSHYCPTCRFQMPTN